MYAMRSGSFARIRAGRLWEWINWRRKGEGGGVWLGREGRRRQKRGKGRREGRSEGGMKVQHTYRQYRCRRCRKLGNYVKIVSTTDSHPSFCSS